MSEYIRILTQNAVMCAIVLFAFSSCSTYSSKFACSDARGLPCEMLRSVDKKIDSGEIDKVYRKICNGKCCTEQRLYEDIAIPKTGPIRAKTASKEEEVEIIIEDDNNPASMQDLRDIQEVK